ncbi:hypothetical protein [Myroides sp. N17-2]|uniref:hypothetical protein n=1 Tax=Myroides sp. N17-2 TaxID=2030799 RepID=UPI000EFAE806|nr:hypothetical protein [Myroides sp. N17-2]
MKEVKELSFEFIDLALSTVIDSDLLDKVPIFGTFNKLCNIGNLFKVKCFEQKLKNFFIEIESIKLEDKIKFKGKIEKLSEYKNLAERILLVLDGFDEVEKATIIGKLFKALILEDITMQQYKKFMYIIDNCFLDDLIEFKEYHSFERREISEEAQRSMLQFGLYEIKVVDINRQRQKNKNARKDDNFNDYNFTDYETSGIGQLILKNGF